MDESGARWGLTGAGHILNLRALAITDSLDEYWGHHLARQHAANTRSTPPQPPNDTPSAPHPQPRH